MASRKERRYAAEQRRILASWEKDRLRHIRALDEMLRQFQTEVLAAMAGITEWDQTRIDEVRRATARALARFQAMAPGYWGQVEKESLAKTILLEDAPLSALGIPTDSIPSVVPERQLAVLQEYVPAQIRRVGVEVQEKVANLLSRAMLGGLDPRDAAGEIGRVVGPLSTNPRGEGTIFSRAQIRGRTILRTETNRLHNLVAVQRGTELAEKIPGVGLKWIHRPSAHPRSHHMALHGKIIFPSEGGRFDVRGVKVLGPHDPDLPAEDVINCHCGVVTVYDSERGRAALRDNPYISGTGEEIPSAGLVAA